jgi:hypothetical protein
MRCNWKLMTATKRKRQRTGKKAKRSNSSRKADSFMGDPGTFEFSGWDERDFPRKAESPPDLIAITKRIEVQIQTN